LRGTSHAITYEGKEKFITAENEPKKVYVID